MPEDLSGLVVVVRRVKVEQGERTRRLEGSVEVPELLVVDFGDDDSFGERRGKGFSDSQRGGLPCGRLDLLAIREGDGDGVPGLF